MRYLTIILLVFVLSFSATAQVPNIEFEFTLYAEDSLGNRDSVVLGYFNDSSAPYFLGIDSLTTKYNQDLDIRVSGVFPDLLPPVYPPDTTWKKGYANYGCLWQSPVLKIAFTSLHPPVKLSWNNTAFQDTCLFHTMFFVKQMYYSYPNTSNGLQKRMALDSFAMLPMDMNDWFTYPNSFVDSTQNGSSQRILEVYVSFMERPIYVGVSETEKEATVGLASFPNPIQNYIYLSPFGAEQIDLFATKVNIYNLSGQLLRSQKFQYELDLSQLASGIYILEWEAGKEKIRKKIVKE